MASRLSLDSFTSVVLYLGYLCVPPCLARPDLSAEHGADHLSPLRLRPGSCSASQTSSSRARSASLRPTLRSASCTVRQQGSHSVSPSQCRARADHRTPSRTQLPSASTRGGGHCWRGAGLGRARGGRSRAQGARGLAIRRRFAQLDRHGRVFSPWLEQPSRPARSSARGAQAPHSIATSTST